VDKKIKIYWLANSSSPHVRHWAELLQVADCNFDVHIISIWHKNILKDVGLKGVTNKRVLPKLFRYFPEILQYLILGIIIRLGVIKKDHVLHAHGTSGYGFVAFISGLKYGLTTYGSEVYSAEAKGLVYQSLLNKILKNAVAITSASPEMTRSLKTFFNIKNGKIHEFSLGVSSKFYYSEQERKRVREEFGINEGPVWIINRRSAPLYHTLELVEAFVSVRQRVGEGHLLVLEGDADKSYWLEVKSLCENNSHITPLCGFVSQSTLRAMLSASDFAISIPDSDQLSSSILEGALCGAVPLLRNLPAYGRVKEFGVFFDIANKASFDEIFNKSLSLYHSSEYVTRVMKVRAEVEKYKMASIIPDILGFYHCISGVLCSKGK